MRKTETTDPKTVDGKSTAQYPVNQRIVVGEQVVSRNQEASGVERKDEKSPESKIHL